MLGLYYRVGFFGELFRDLKGQEYIYKEADGERIGGFMQRLRDVHVARFGASRVNMIQDSKKLDLGKLDPNMAHIQVVAVDPYFEPEDAESRVGTFEFNHGVSAFSLETPFTKGGKAHGTAATQCLELLVMKVADGLSFPCGVKRLEIKKWDTLILNPIDVAIKAMKKKIDGLDRIVSAKGPASKDARGPHPDMKGLQLQLQGIVSIQVNAGPMEYANVFLNSSDTFDPEKITALQEHFGRMLQLVDLGLKRNAKTISEDQEEYQRDLEEKYELMRQALQPMLDDDNDQAALDDATGHDMHDVLQQIGHSAVSSPSRRTAIFNHKPLDFLALDTSPVKRPHAAEAGRQKRTSSA